MLLRTAKAKRCTENNQGDGRGRRRHLPDGLQHGLWHMNAQYQEQSAHNGAKDHGILQHAQENRPERKPAAPKGLQHEHAKDIVNRDNHRDHHGRDRDFAVPEDVRGNRDAHEHEVAAEQCLRHHAPPPVLFLHAADQKHADEADRHHAEASIEHKLRAEDRCQFRRIDAVEHHAGKKDLEYHAVHMIELLLRKELIFFYHRADEHQAEHRNDRAHRHDKIAFHPQITVPLSLLYSYRECFSIKIKEIRVLVQNSIFAVH